MHACQKRYAFRSLKFSSSAWGPLEPFDNSFPELLRLNNTYTHLVTDHYHYFEDGGATYHNRFNSYDFINNFTLYLSIDHLSNLFTDKSYLLMFWIHFVAINLFTGGWIVKDSQKFYINRILLTIPLIITYLIGPIGLLFYWLIRIFYAKNINLYD